MKKKRVKIAALTIIGLIAAVGCGTNDIQTRSASLDTQLASVAGELNDHASCRFNIPESEPSVSERGDIVSARFAAHYTVAQINTKIREPLPRAKNGVDAFTIEYQSVDLENKPTVLSGLILIPTNCKKELPTISLQHYTMVADHESPSVEGTHGMYEASQGYYTVSSDYIGYGSSQDKFHPYLIEASYTHPLVDMLRSAKKLAGFNQVDVERHLFLKGFSEGGYATLALLKTLESDTYKNEFKATAAAPTAGPYNLYAMAAGAMSLETSNPFIPFIITSFVELLPLNMKLDEILKNTRTIDFVDLFSGKFTGYEVMTKIPQTMVELMDDAYRTLIIDNFQTLSAGGSPQLSAFEQALMENSLTTAPWKIATPTKFYQCQDDDVVPAPIAQQAYDIFSKLSNKVGIEMIPSPADTKYDHGNCPAFYTPIAWFDKILQGEADPLVDASHQRE